MDLAVGIKMMACWRKRRASLLDQVVCLAGGYLGLPSMKYNAHKRQRMSVVWIWGSLLEAAPPLSCK